MSPKKLVPCPTQKFDTHAFCIRPLMDAHFLSISCLKITAITNLLQITTLSMVVNLSLEHHRTRASMRDLRLPLMLTFLHTHLPLPLLCLPMHSTLLFLHRCMHLLLVCPLKHRHQIKCINWQGITTVTHRYVPSSHHDFLVTGFY